MRKIYLRTAEDYIGFVSYKIRTLHFTIFISTQQKGQASRPQIISKSTHESKTQNNFTYQDLLSSFGFMKSESATSKLRPKHSKKQCN